MSHELYVILNVAIAVAIALVGGLVAHQLRQPAIIGYLVAGIVIGPFSPGFVGDREQISSLAEVGVIFLMFALGIEFSLKELARVKGVAILGTAAQVLLTLGGGTLLGVLIGWPIGQSIFFGGVISIASTMVILKMLIDRGEMDSPHGRVTLGMLIVQDLAAVLLIVVLPQLTSGEGIDPNVLFFTLFKAVVFIAVMLFLGARVVPRLMHYVESLGSELFLLTAVALALGTAAISGWLGLSVALGAFLGGILLTETEFDHRVVAEVVPMRNLFATLFFVSIGMLIDPMFILNNLLAVVGLALAIMVIKAVVTLVVVAPFRLGAKTTAFTALAMVQIGEFSYVLAEAGVEAGVISTELNNLILTSSVLTIVATPLAFRAAPLLTMIERFRSIASPRGALPDDPVRLNDHVVVIGYGRVGRQVVAGVRATNVPVVVIEEDLHLVQELRSEGIPAIFGDASLTQITAAARIDGARLIVVALPDSGTIRTVVRHSRNLNKLAPIIARAASHEDEERLLRVGATAVVTPERAGAALILDAGLKFLDQIDEGVWPDYPIDSVWPEAVRTPYG